MKEKMTIFDFLAHVMVIYGFIMLVLNIFALILGDAAKSSCSIFALGSRGLTVDTALQFLLFTVLIVTFRLIFFTERVIHTMAPLVRKLLLFASIIAVVALFSAFFGWFPVDHWEAWLVFFLFFGISFALSSLFMAWKERTENRELQDALERYQDHKENRRS